MTGAISYTRLRTEPELLKRIGIIVSDKRQSIVVRDQLAELLRNMRCDGVDISPAAKELEPAANDGDGSIRAKVRDALDPTATFESLRERAIRNFEKMLDAKKPPAEA